MSRAIIIEKSASQAPNVAGEQITVLASGDQTGIYEVFYQAGREGSGPPPHNHPWDESFYVTRGEIAFGVDDQEAVARLGTFVHIPAGTPHWFRFGPGGGEILSLTWRAGATNMFADFDREIAPDNPYLAKLIEIIGCHGADPGTPEAEPRL